MPGHTRQLFEISGLKFGVAICHEGWRYPETVRWASATCLIDPSGECQAYLPYGQEDVLVQSINLEAATGLLASRYAPERYREFSAE